MVLELRREVDSFSSFSTIFYSTPAAIPPGPLRSLVSVFNFNSPPPEPSRSFGSDSSYFTGDRFPVDSIAVLRPPLACEIVLKPTFSAKVSIISSVSLIFLLFSGVMSHTISFFLAASSNVSSLPTLSNLS